MIKTTLAAGAMAAALAMSGGAAEAKTSVHIGIGIGGYPCYDRYNPIYCGDYQPPYNDPRAAQFLSERTGIPAVMLPFTVSSLILMPSAFSAAGIISLLNIAVLVVVSAMLRARRVASVTTCSVPTRRSIRPMRKASAASIRSPLSVSSLAWPAKVSPYSRCSLGAVVRKLRAISCRCSRAFANG